MTDAMAVSDVPPSTRFGDSLEGSWLLASTVHASEMAVFIGLQAVTMVGQLRQSGH